MKKILLFGFVFLFHPMVSADLYRILGVMSDSSLEKITKNYERTKERIHPEHNSNSRESRERFEELEAAYTLLSDSDRRSQYDEHLKKAQTDKESNFYKTIGVLPDSSPTQITKAYKERRAVVHPDRHNNNEESNRRFKELQNAFKTLADPVLRSKHDASLGKSHTLPRFSAEREQRQRNLREQASNRQGRAKAVQTGVDGEDESSAEGDVAIWNKQVFELAQELEKEGGDEDIEEAIFWYRMLAQEDHVQAVWRLALLLEETDPEETLYRLGQVQVLDSDSELTRSAIFRQAQLYQIGVYEGEKKLLAKDPDKASELYEEAFRLGVSPWEIAKQYDKHHDYTKALEWQQRVSNGSGKQELTEDTEITQEQESQIMGVEFGWSVGGGISGFTDLHLAVMHRDEKGVLRESQQSVINMIRSVFNEKIDINAQDSVGDTPINEAVRRLYFQAVELLLEMGADVNIPNKRGDTALHIALMRWSLRPESLVGKNVNARDKETIRQTLSSLVKKADLSIRNDNMYLSVELAVFYNHPEVAAEIIERGGAESLTNEEYHQLVKQAIYRGHSDAVRLLKQMPVPVKKVPVKRTSPGFVSQLVNFCKAALSPKPKPTTQEAGDP